MKRRLLVQAIALTAATLFILAGTALAAEWTESTGLTVKASPGTTIEENEKVTFSGKLQSDRKKCKSGVTVRLVRIGKGVVDKTTTADNGAYEFPRRGLQVVTADWRVIFRGFTEGVHPNIHTCRASQSRVITITV